MFCFWLRPFFDSNHVFVILRQGGYFESALSQGENHEYHVACSGIHEQGRIFFFCVALYFLLCLFHDVPFRLCIHCAIPAFAASGKFLDRGYAELAWLLSSCDRYRECVHGNVSSRFFFEGKRREALDAFRARFDPDISAGVFHLRL